MFYDKPGGVIIIMYSALSIVCLHITQMKATQPAYFACKNIKNANIFIPERNF